MLSELKPAPGVKVTVTPALCEPRTFTVDLQPGSNAIPFQCQAFRRIQGMLRTGGDATLAAGARVRCSSDRASQPVFELFFLLECPEQQASMEYQLSPTHPWHTVAVQPGDANSIAFVDIPVD